MYCERALTNIDFFWYCRLTAAVHTYSAASGKVMPMKADDRYSVYISMPVPLM